MSRPRRRGAGLAAVRAGRRLAVGARGDPAPDSGEPVHRGRHARRGDGGPALADAPVERGARESPRRGAADSRVPRQSADRSAAAPGFVAAGDLPENYVPRHSVQTPGPAAEPAAPISGPIPIVRPAHGDSTEAGRPPGRDAPRRRPSLPPAGVPLPVRKKRNGPGTPLVGRRGAAGPWSRPGASLVPSEPVQRLGAPPGMLGGAEPAALVGSSGVAAAGLLPRPSRCRPSRPARTTTGAPPSTTRRASRARRAGSPPIATTPITPTTTPTTPTTRPVHRRRSGRRRRGRRCGRRRRTAGVHRRRGRGPAVGTPRLRHPARRTAGRRTMTPPESRPKQPRRTTPRRGRRHRGAARALRGDHRHPAGGRRPDDQRRRAAARPARGDPRATGVGGPPGPSRPAP